MNSGRAVVNPPDEPDRPTFSELASEIADALFREEDSREDYRQEQHELWLETQREVLGP